MQCDELYSESYTEFYVILCYIVAVFDLNLNFSNFPIATGPRLIGLEV